MTLSGGCFYHRAMRVEREPFAVDATVAEFIPLARAAALAHEKLFDGESARDMKSINMRSAS